MDYNKIHDAIIDRAIRAERTKSKTDYYELHHILPKSLGGSNHKSNLVLLTAREHYIVHKCLVKIHVTNHEFYRKMVFALHRFIYSVNSDYGICSREYERIKLLHRENISIELSGKTKSEETRMKMSTSQKKYFENNVGHWTGKTHSDETKAKMSKSQSKENNPQFGRSRTEEEKNKISSSMKGHKKTKETVEKFKSRRWSEEKKLQIAEKVRLYHERKRQNSEMGSSVS